MAGISMFLLGILMEAGQHFSPGRAVELGDVLAKRRRRQLRCLAGPSDPSPDRHSLSHA